jgi:methionyl-tRNA formyltransferase
MKIVFAGTPEFAVPPLQALIEAGYEVVGIITQEDKPQGRKGILTPSPVKQVGLEFSIPVFQPKKIKEEVAGVKALGGDILITCAYGQILTQAVLDCFPLGVWNIHAGLLPKYRGASPIQSTILAGEKETGVSIMQTQLGLDSGDVLLVERTEIVEGETSGELSSRLSSLGAKALVSAVKMIENGDYTLQKQGEEGVQVFKKITGEMALIDFSKEGKQIVNAIRAFNPEPIAYAYLNGNRVNFFKGEFIPYSGKEQCGEILSEKPKQGLLVKCKDGIVKLVEVQPAGGKRMSGGDFMNGRKGEKGQVFYADESHL